MAPVLLHTASWQAAYCTLDSLEVRQRWPRRSPASVREAPPTKPPADFLHLTRAVSCRGIFA
jgi:hypothetical protein